MFSIAERGGSIADRLSDELCRAVRAGQTQKE